MGEETVKPGVVYEIWRRTPRELLYVGSTGDLDRRVANHFGQRGTFFLLDRVDFEVRVVWRGLCTRAQLLARERAHTEATRPPLNRCAGSHVLREVPAGPGPVVRIDDRRPADARTPGERVFIDVQRGGRSVYTGFTTCTLDERWFAELVNHRPALREDAEGYTVVVGGPRRCRPERLRRRALYVIRDACTGRAVYVGSSGNVRRRVEDHVRRDALALVDPDAYEVCVVHVLPPCTRGEAVAAEAALTEALIAAGEPLHQRRVGAHVLRHRPDAAPVVNQLADREAAAEQARQRMKTATTWRGATHVYRCLDTGAVYASAQLAAAAVGARPDNIYQAALGMRRSTGGYRWALVDRAQLTDVERAEVDHQVTAATGVAGGSWRPRAPRRNPLSRRLLVCLERRTVHRSCLTAALAEGVCAAALVNAAKGRSATAAGAHWAYIDLDELTEDQRAVLEEGDVAEATPAQLTVLEQRCAAVHDAPVERPAARVVHFEIRLDGRVVYTGFTKGPLRRRVDQLLLPSGPLAALRPRRSTLVVTEVAPPAKPAPAKPVPRGVVDASTGNRFPSVDAAARALGVRRVLVGNALAADGLTRGHRLLWADDPRLTTATLAGRTTVEAQALVPGWLAARLRAMCAEAGQNLTTRSINAVHARRLGFVYGRADGLLVATVKVAAALEGVNHQAFARVGTEDWCTVGRHRWRLVPKVGLDVEQLLMLEGQVTLLHDVPLDILAADLAESVSAVRTHGRRRPLNRVEEFTLYTVVHLDTGAVIYCGVTAHLDVRWRDHMRSGRFAEFAKDRLRLVVERTWRCTRGEAMLVERLRTEELLAAGAPLLNLRAGPAVDVVTEHSRPVDR